MFRGFLLFFLLVSSLNAFSASKSFHGDDIFFFSARDVLEIYEGKWVGSEELSLRGRLLGNIKSENNNKLMGDSILSCVGVATMANEIIDSKSSMIVLENTIYLVSKDENSMEVIYEGRIKSNSVEWFRNRKIFAYDYSKDVFTKEGNIVTMRTYSVKPYKTKDSALIYLEYKGALSKDITPRQKLKVNPENLDVSKLKI